MKPLRGLKEAVGTYQKNCKNNHCVIYLDTESGYVWANTYSSESFQVWKATKSIHALNTYIQEATGDTKITMESVRRTAEHVRKLYEAEQ